jgi:hypothetical protein
MRDVKRQLPSAELRAISNDSARLFDLLVDATEGNSKFSARAGKNGSFSRLPLAEAH